MNNTTEEKNLFDRIVEFGATAPEEIEIPGGRPVVVVPGTCKVESLKDFYPPERIERTVNLLEAGSFADYVNKFKMPETLIFVTVTETGCTFRAMLDYHAAAPELTPAFCAHQAIFQAVETPDWKTWKAQDRKYLEQVPFANWLEENSRLVVEPKGAELLEIVQTLHGHNNARFNTSVRLDNGSYSAAYEEDRVVKGVNSITSGEIELPKMIKAGIAVFQGAARYEVNARMKSKIENRKLSLCFETVAITEIVRESILLLVAQVSEKTGIVPLIGTP